MWTEGRVIERIDWNSKLFSLRIAAEIAPFIAGQFIKLSQVRDDKRIARAYSLVNAPGTDYLEILAVAVDQGQLSPDLQSLQPGDSISVTDKATGFMTLDEIPKGNYRGATCGFWQQVLLWGRFFPCWILRSLGNGLIKWFWFTG